MGQYFFKMSQAEKNNILDKHKTIYDGYVTEYGQQNNTQPLYVQDYANDKGGMVVSNKGVVKPYTNMGINESHTGLDMIGDNPNHLSNGTVDLEDFGFNPDHELMHDTYPSPNENEFDYISLGKQDDECKHCDDDNLDVVIDIDDNNLNDIKPNDEDIPEETFGFGFEDVDDDVLPEFIDKLHESLDMFQRFKKYN